MLMDIYNEEFEKVKRKDVKMFKRNEERLRGDTEQDRRFSKKVSEIHAVMGTYCYTIADVIKDALDNEVARMIIGKTYSHAVVVSVLKDYEFIAFLISSNLIRRTANLSYESPDQLKIRIYLSILNFDEYKKKKWCE